MKRLGWIAALAPLALVAAAPAAAQTQDWTATRSVSPAGGHVLGNPQAEMKLIEFVSYTCPHCARFVTDSKEPLHSTYVQPGRLSVEVRHIIRDPVDMTAALLAQCGPADRFWGNHEAIFSSHDQWMAKARATTPEQRQRWTTGVLGNRFKAIAADLGFYDLMQQRGYSRGELDRCLSDQASVQTLAERSQAAGESFNVQGTPSFALNGKLLDGVHGWDSLRSALESGRN